MAVFYELKRVETSTDGFATAAIHDCALCGDVIDGMGGPGRGSICVSCAEKIYRGEAKGAIKRDSR